MNKYIRTDDGVYEVEKLNLNKIVGNIKYEIINNKLLKTMYGYEAHLFEYDILAQADTIEELCDEFVGIYKGEGNEPHFQETSLNSLIEETKKYCYHNTTLDDLNIYGAIWTDKGLIYVAKLNDKGELELI